MDTDSRRLEWDRAARRSAARPYLDPRIADVKRRAHLSLFERWLPPLRGRSVLKTDLWEEGVGGDELLFTLAPQAREAHGVDVSAEVVARAAERADAAGIDLALDRGDVCSLPFSDGGFDVIVSTSTIDHLEGEAEHRQALLELRRVLAPGGTLLVTVDNPANVTDWLLRLGARAGLLPFPLAVGPSLEQLLSLLAATGFRPERHEYLVPAPRVLTTAVVRLTRLLPSRGADRAVAAELRLLDAAGRRAPRRLGSFVAVLARAG